MSNSHNIMSYGERLPPHIVDARAKSGYERPYAMYPRTKDPADGFQAINYARLANAVNRVAWWLEEHVNEPKKDNYAFAYFGPNDLRYIIFVLAAMKTERKILIASLRNTVDAQLSLFEKANCKALVSCSSLSLVLQPLFSASENVQKIQAPDLDEVLAEDEVPHYAYEKTFDEVAETIFLVLHTSGSSGNPKPIYWTIRFLCNTDSGHLLPTGEGTHLTKSFFTHQNALILLPCFHAGGLVTNLFPAFYEMTLVLGYPSVSMSGDYVSKLLRENIVSVMLTPPSILEDVSAEPEGIKWLEKLRHIGYAGGPLQPSIGNALAPSMQHLFSFMGATEYGWFHCIEGGSENWDALNFFSGIGYHFDEVSDGSFELVIMKESQTAKYHGVFETFPTLQEYRTRDLYSRATHGSGWWQYKGRADDLIVLSNGEKINPVPLENLVRTHPKIRAALVVGEYRFSPSLLLELGAQDIPTTTEGKRRTLDEIWPVVQEANKIAPAFAKIPKSLIIFSKPEKPFRRAGKGTVQRQNTVREYSEELDQLFSSQETSLLTECLSLATPISPGIVKTFTREVYLQTLQMKELKDVSEMDDMEDVFGKGLDSLGVIVIVQRLKAALKSCQANIDLTVIDSRFVYSAPSVNQASDAIVALLENRNEYSHRHESPVKVLRQSKMQEILQKYSKDLPSISLNDPTLETLTKQSSAQENAWKVILTGTTGSLGSYLLTAIEALPESRVAKVYCLNRSANSKARQKKGNRSRGMTDSWSDARVEFLQADLSMQQLGLAPDIYHQLIDEATVIIHCAWKVDFNLTIESFEPQIRGVRNLLDFSLHSKNKAPMVFVSSISTALGSLAKMPNSTVPEAIIRDFEAPERLGYGESKYISEVLIEDFAKASGVPAAIFRTGQIAGPLSKRGYWNKQEWLPSIVASSMHLKVLPETLGAFENIDWVPVDILSSIMVELVNKLVSEDNGVGKTLVYNLVNPKVTSWSRLLPAVQNLTRTPRTLPLVRWVDELEKSVQDNHGIITDQNPGAKLINFFRMLSNQKEIPTNPKLSFEVTKLLRDSKQASKLEPVSAKWVTLWMEQWSFYHL